MQLMNTTSPASIYDFSATGIDGQPVDLAQFRGQVLLVVNTASACGFTPQFAGADPLYQWLTATAPGLLGTRFIKWNFTKFLVGRDGQVLKRYAPTDTPQSLQKDIAAALGI
jgi:glutathione peroxidase-family protein